MEPYRDAPFEEEGGDVVAVASYATPVEAELAREHLAEHGILARVQESASFNPLISVAAGGTRLLIRDADESRARHLLRRLAHAQPADDDEPGEVRCPRCELTYCTFGTALATATVPPAFTGLAVLLLLPLGLTKKRWRCQRCLHVWDDRDEGPQKRTPLHPDDPHPVFRLGRHRAGTGLTAGIGLMFAAMLLSGALRAPPVWVAALVLPFAGYVVGKRVKHDVCSNPDCRAELRPGERECKSCSGAVAGAIRSANEHWSETAAVRRELWALRNEEEPARSPRKKARIEGDRPLLTAPETESRPRKKKRVKKAAPEGADEA